MMATASQQLGMQREFLFAANCELILFYSVMAHWHLCCSRFWRRSPQWSLVAKMAIFFG